MDSCKHVRVAAWMLLTAVMLLSGCSSEQRVEYDYPKAFCGVPVERALLKPFFPPGNKLRKSGNGVDSSLVYSYCQYYVDGTGGIKVEFTRRIDSDTLQEIVKIVAGDRNVTFDASGKFALLDDGNALGVAECAHSLSDDGKPRSYTVEIIVPGAEDIQGVRAKLTALMKALLPAAVKADGC